MFTIKLQNPKAEPLPLQQRQFFLYLFHLVKVMIPLFYIYISKFGIENGFRCLASSSKSEASAISYLHIEIGSVPAHYF